MRGLFICHISTSSNRRLMPWFCNCSALRTSPLPLVLVLVLCLLRLAEDKSQLCVVVLRDVEYL